MRIYNLLVYGLTEDYALFGILFRLHEVEASLDFSANWWLFRGFSSSLFNILLTTYMDKAMSRLYFSTKISSLGQFTVWAITVVGMHVLMLVLPMTLTECLQS